MSVELQHRHNQHKDDLNYRNQAIGCILIFANLNKLIKIYNLINYTLIDLPRKKSIATQERNQRISITSRHISK